MLHFVYGSTINIINSQATKGSLIDYLFYFT
jgi:hypothetical protein